MGLGIGYAWKTKVVTAQKYEGNRSLRKQPLINREKKKKIRQIPSKELPGV